VNVDFGSVFLQLRQDLVDVALVGEHEDELQLGHLDVDGVVVFAEEDADVVLKDLWSALQDEQRISQRQVLHLRALGEQRHQWW